MEQCTTARSKHQKRNSQTTANTTINHRLNKKRLNNETLLSRFLLLTNQLLNRYPRNF